MNPVTPMKFAIQRTLRRFGWEIRRFSLDEMAHLNQMLDHHRVDTVIDVGANIGQFGSALRAAGFTGRIISFEPQSDAYERLCAIAAQDSRWDVAPRCAVGDTTSEITINISGNSVSSSALPILDAHTGSAPASRYVAHETAPLIKLDDCDFIPRAQRLFLKIDTQGYEQQVLDGAPELLKTIIGAKVELSFAPLYDGQADYIAILTQMRSLDFDVWAVNPGFGDQSSGRLLQADITFFRMAI